MEVQQARVQDRGQVCKSHMKIIALESPTVSLSAAQMYGLMFGANT